MQLYSSSEMILYEIPLLIISVLANPEKMITDGEALSWLIGSSFLRRLMSA